MTKTSIRLSSVDALRGWALAAIVLLHCLEHYNLFCIPSFYPEWLLKIDSRIFDTTFALLGGNAYATFSLLFGFSFFIQMRNARKRGCDFRLRFAWRMILLSGFAILHSLFYNGDILLLYAVCGLLLIPASSWSNRTILILAIILALQPYAWGKIIYAALTPGYVDTDSLFMPFAIAADEVGRNGDIAATLWSNICDGILYSNLWQVESGRISLTPALFLIGMLLGRLDMFAKSGSSVSFWRRTLFWAIVAAIPFYILKIQGPQMIENPTIMAYYNVAIARILNAVSTAILISIFLLCWFRRTDGYRIQRMLIPYGRMSLTNYIGQSIIGVSLFYHCGFGLYDKTGASACIAIALCIVAFQTAISKQWLKRHRQGPLEHIWKRLTWLNFDKSTSDHQPSITKKS